MPTPIQNPAGYAVTRAIAYADVDGSMVQVAAAAPLPVSIGASAATTPLAGTSSTSTVAGPYQPALGRAVILALSGTWNGTVNVTRSTDGGTTRLGVKLVIANPTGAAIDRAATELGVAFHHQVSGN